MDFLKYLQIPSFNCFKVDISAIIHKILILTEIDIFYNHHNHLKFRSKMIKVLYLMQDFYCCMMSTVKNILQIKSNISDGFILWCI